MNSIPSVPSAPHYAPPLLFSGELLMIRTDPRSGGVYPVNGRGLLLTHTEANELITNLQTFYADCTAEEIAELNHPKTEGVVDRSSRFSGPAVMNKHPGFVYLMESDGRYKIGLSKDVEVRRKAIEQAIKKPVSIVCRHFAQNCGEVERRLHERFEDRHIREEWFALTPEDIEEFRRWKAGVE